jgi:hypothetical protein
VLTRREFERVVSGPERNTNSRLLPAPPRTTSRAASARPGSSVGCTHAAPPACLPARRAALNAPVRRFVLCACATCFSPTARVPPAAATFSCSPVRAPGALALPRVPLHIRAAGRRVSGVPRAGAARRQWRPSHRGCCRLGQMAPQSRSCARRRPPRPGRPARRARRSTWAWQRCSQEPLRARARARRRARHARHLATRAHADNTTLPPPVALSWHAGL